MVRVSGPITGNEMFSYEENLDRFIKAQQVLRDKGFTVFDYFEDNDDEKVIQKHELQDLVMEYYHQPILQSGYLAAVYMMPYWELSGGARAEYQHFVENGLPIEHIPEEWLQ